MIKKYFISGIGPGKSGVGRLIKNIILTNSKPEVGFIYRREKLAIKEMLDENKYLSVFLEFLYRFIDDIKFNVNCILIRGKEVVFMHPQTASYRNLFRLMKHNKLSIYVMDSSFFCIRSYNTNPNSNSECLQCLGDISPYLLCEPFPAKISKTDNIVYLNNLLLLYRKVDFLVQNVNQERLLRRHFGYDVNVKVVGMDTGECVDNVIFPYKYNCEKNFNIVFHGSSHPAKGICYVIDLAENLPNYSFLVPSSRVEVEVSTQRDVLPNNVFCIEMNWENGLKEQVKCADLVINPSMWSAPIEGALIKSAYYNYNVATVETSYGFEAEFDGIKNHLRLPVNILAASNEVREFMESL